MRSNQVDYFGAFEKLRVTSERKALRGILGSNPGSDASKSARETIEILSIPSRTDVDVLGEHGGTLKNGSQPADHDVSNSLALESS
jgi:hypothetical protein